MNVHKLSSKVLQEHLTLIMDMVDGKRAKNSRFVLLKTCASTCNDKPRVHSSVLLESIYNGIVCGQRSAYFNYYFYFQKVAISEETELQFVLYHVL